MKNIKIPQMKFEFTTKKNIIEFFMAIVLRVEKEITDYAEKSLF